MSQDAKVQTLCPAHAAKISVACFSKGCPQALLCRKCYKDHPHEHEDEIQEIADMIDDNSWIEAVEKQRDLELAKIKNIYEQNKEIRVENEKLLDEFVQSIIIATKAQKQLWMKELDGLLSFSDQQERELDVSLTLLTSFEFGGDIVERITKKKSFQDNVLPNTTQMIETFQVHFNKGQTDKEKVEALKVELTGIIQTLSLKNFLMLEPFKSIRISEEQVVLERESKEFKDSMDAKVESLNQKIEDLITQNAKLKSQLDETIEAKGHLENDYEKEVATLKNKITELENFKKSMGFEDSKIIQPEGFTKLKEWIPKPLPSTVIQFRLIYRASRDGWSAKDFHIKCDGSTPTIAVIKSKDYERVFGGYTTKSWGLNTGWVEDKDAFIFSLTHGEKYACNNPSNAIYAESRESIVFGAGSDIDISLNKDCISFSSNFPHSYECSRFPKPNPESVAYLAGDQRCQVKDIEVYQVLYL